MSIAEVTLCDKFGAGVTLGTALRAFWVLGNILVLTAGESHIWAISKRLFVPRVEHPTFLFYRFDRHSLGLAGFFGGSGGALGLSGSSTGQIALKGNWLYWVGY